MRLLAGALILTASGLAIAGYPLALVLILPAWCCLAAAYRTPLLRLLKPLYDELPPEGDGHQDHEAARDYRDML